MKVTATSKPLNQSMYHHPHHHVSCQSHKNLTLSYGLIWWRMFLEASQTLASASTFANSVLFHILSCAIAGWTEANRKVFITWKVKTPKVLHQLLLSLYNNKKALFSLKLNSSNPCKRFVILSRQWLGLVYDKCMYLDPSIGNFTYLVWLENIPALVMCSKEKFPNSSWMSEVNKCIAFVHSASVAIID